MLSNALELPREKPAGCFSCYTHNMPPKRKAATAKKAESKKAKQAEPKEAEPEQTEPAPAPAAAKKASSPKKAKPVGSMSAAELWGSPDHVQDGKMTQEGFASVLTAIGIELMTFEAVYFSYSLCPTTEVIEDPNIVCQSKQALQSCLDRLGARKLDDVPQQLASKKAQLTLDYNASAFTPFFHWLFEMGKAISAANRSIHSSAVRVVPLDVGMMLMEAALSSWPLFPRLKTFCEEKHAAPITKDLWTQIGRFARLTTTGTIRPDLSNYDDDAAGGGAWPCAIDDFVEFVQEAST